MREYLWATRRPGFNVVYTAALLAVYEIGLLLVDENRRNAADVFLKSSLERLGPWGPHAFNGALLVLFLWFGWRGLERGERFVRYLPAFFVETASYALLLSPAVLYLRVPFLSNPLPGDLILDLGAGVYEEIVFRFVLLRGALWLMHIDPWHAVSARDGVSPMAHHAGSVTLVVLGSALAFSLYHHVGSGGEAFDFAVFAFRFVAGLLLALVYLARGLAVAAYTHAIYDVLMHLAT